MITVPTVDLNELVLAAEECAARLAIYVNTAPVETDRRLREIERRHGEDNMFHVRRLRAAVARVRGE